MHPGTAAFARSATLLAGLLAWGSAAPAQEAARTDVGVLDPAAAAKPFRKIDAYSPYAGWNYPMRVFWGDQHVHTGWSADAGAFGCTLGPEEALRLARGEEVMASTGQPAKLSRPLDWAAITDHSDGAGTIFEIRAGNPEFMKDPDLKRWHEMMKQGPEEGVKAASEMIRAQSTGKVSPIMKDPKFARSIWAKNTAIMEKYNEPGRFTAFIGYEWTSNAGGGDNLHRNVIYRGGKAQADQVLPLTTFDSENPEDLWKWMEAWEKKTGGRLLAIPHNGNLSNGRMFVLTTFLGNPLTRQWAETRAKWEPLYEATQIKGDGETHPSLSTTDEFAAYERWDKGNLNLVPKQPGMIQYEYARRALQNGLALEQELGVNPFKFGLVSGTDTHTGLSTAEEENFFGKHTGVEPSADRWKHLVIQFQDRKVEGWEMAAAGWTGVWATENTRESLWDAMKRRETYSTTGPRMTVRFFGGFDFVASDVQSRLPAEAGYTKGVPMGGDLRATPDGRPPTFLVYALKDPIGGNLDRIQIVKGWLDAKGGVQEKVYDVAWSDGRKPGRDGKLPAVGSSVDVANATWTNTIGDPELGAVWQDPSFDPKLRAFYYARAIQIPTPRWTAYDAKRFGVQMPPEVPMVTQERAYTSPIWYTPGA
ncbi:MAG TPA: DUF3604 domain-containing protein [Myxococcota bacterium]|nr:DUF3604 domain-containing protein [Myxococcota bacterium]